MENIYDHHSDPQKIPNGDVPQSSIMWEGYLNIPLSALETHRMKHYLYLALISIMFFALCL